MSFFIYQSFFFPVGNHDQLITSDRKGSPYNFDRRVPVFNPKLYVSIRFENVVTSYRHSHIVNSNECPVFPKF